jgi:hypothetical protein
MSRTVFYYSRFFNTKPRIKLAIILATSLLALIYVHLPQPLYYYFVRDDRFIPEVLNDSLSLKSACKCKNDIVQIKKQNNSYYLVQSSTRRYAIDVNKYNLGAVTCDLYSVLSRGPDQNVIGLSLYGNNSLYYEHLREISDMASKHYPEWIIRIHYDESVNKSFICELECAKKNIDFCYVKHIPFGSARQAWDASYMHKMTWRWLPIGDPFVNYFMSRDSDSWIIDREVKAAQVWTNSNTLFHVMRGMCR